jgi:hypothetical protein
MSIALLTALAAAVVVSPPGVAAGPAADPLAPAWAGQVQCYAPNVARHTCLSIGSYAKGADGAVASTAVVLLASRPQIVMRSTAPVTVRGAAVCGVLAARDLETATFTLDGEPADPADAAEIRKAIAPSYAPMLNRELCSIFVPGEPDMRAQVSVDGRRRPELDLPVRWISPAEGYEVKP